MNLINYKNFVYFGTLCEVPKYVLSNITDYYNSVKDSPEHSEKSNTYKQWLVQESRNSHADIDITYNHWVDDGQLDPTKHFFNNFVTKIYRFRVSWLSHNGEVDYHCQHQLPRIHIPLNDADSNFIIRDDSVEYEFTMKYGYAYFINVTFDHKVVPTLPIDRLNSFFSFTNFKSVDLIEKFKK